MEALRNVRDKANKDYENQIKDVLARPAAKGTKGSVLFLDKSYLPGELTQVNNLIDS